MSVTNATPTEPIATSLANGTGAANSPPQSLYSTWKAIPAELARLSLERYHAEAATSSALAARTQRAQEALDQAMAQAEERRVRETGEANSLIANLRRQVTGTFEAEIKALRDEQQNRRRTAIARYNKQKNEAVSTHQASKWELGAIHETAEKGANEWRKDSKDRLAVASRVTKELQDATRAVLGKYRGFVAQNPPEIVADAGEIAAEDPFVPLHESIAQADAALLKLESLFLPQSFAGAKMAWLYVLPLLISVPPLLYFLGPTAGGIVGTVVGIALGVALQHLATKKGRESVEALRIPLQTSLARADALLKHCEIFVNETFAKRKADALARRDAEALRSDRDRDRKLTEAEEARAAKVGEADEAAGRRTAEATAIRDRALKDAEQTEAHRRGEIAAQFAADSTSAREQHRRSMDEAEGKHRADWDRQARAWQAGIQKIVADVAEIRREMDGRYPDWHDPGSHWIAPTRLPAAVKLGEIRLPMSQVKGGVSRDAKLKAMAPDEFLIPAILAFPEHSSVVVDFAGEEGRRRATESMQSLMLRYLTGMPPGKVRFTIIDPVGLGRGFAAFMHLADYAEAMVNGRIWTEPQQIDQRLAELNLHIETVIQDYLRNEYPTIEDYNEHAGEVAEPYRVLVVADFPAGFTEASARRLAAIAQSGPRCGVYTILGLDRSQALPPNVENLDLVPGAVKFSWREKEFVLRDRDYEPFPFTPDAPPSPEAFTKLLHRVGEAAREANRVEVPFEVIAPRPEDYWKGSTASIISVPLGRAGATKLQNLTLGKGTSQHVLTAGRTGSGKSTLLHALITNAALMYSPDEVELYLIDFKKGVEFKTYATQGLPHARVVAIESEREFGLSVLQRLDVELKVRGDRYRDLGVQDLAGYRKIPNQPPLPRLLLIVDEFQEFFVEDDKLAQEAGLMFDRLVRQGRAFGIHVILGSQTLSGAYSLARSTLGQMAVRIALQCSEADAQLILNEDNSAARLLSRPGEAIYNDANGMKDGNHHFQVVWLPDANREQYLKKIAELSAIKGIVPRPQIVFEGNLPSDLSQHPIFTGDRAGNTTTPKTLHAWLGEAVAIKDPTSAAFRPQGGANLLMVGQNEELASGVMFAAVLGLAAQASMEAKFYILDGVPEESTFAGTLARLGDVIPQPFRVGGLRDAGPILAEVAAEVDRRQAGGGDAAPIFLVVQDLPRFRDLRKQDDDFSFSRRGKEETISPAKALGTILREGPALGVHTLVWCDSVNNMNRAFDRQALREFEMRVLFQMSASDSSNLIDSPAASRLGENRGLFSSEEQGRTEKFRPYGLPSPGWLASLKSRGWKSE